MKTTKAGIIDMVAQLANIIEVRKAQEKVEKEIKAVLKDFMGDDAILEAGGYMVLIEARTRTDLDKKALLAEVGQEIITKCSKTLEYEIMSVKSTVRSV